MEVYLCITCVIPLIKHDRQKLDKKKENREKEEDVWTERFSGPEGRCFRPGFPWISFILSSIDIIIAPGKKK